MPLRIPDNLPASQVLELENIFCISDAQAQHQDIRPQKILLLNLMPKKIDTEIHLLRMLSNTPLQVEVDLMRSRQRTRLPLIWMHFIKTSAQYVATSMTA